MEWSECLSTKDSKIFLVKGTLKNYFVTIFYGEWRCTCPSFLFREGDCKHIKSLKEDLNITEESEEKKETL
jgi:predicted nucleic acid-binding Zn finger protein